MKEQDVKVTVCSFLELFTKEAIFPIGIDTYQRPYVWGEDKVQELINDLTEYLKDPKGLCYYMGNVLLHQHNQKQKLFIIDGQQRLTTLSILYFVLNGKFTDGDKMTMEYHSPLSTLNIKKTQLLFDGIKEQWKDKADFLFSNINLTCITTLEEDMAFTFFDTQNNRGVKLNPTDLLKAYHLRSIGNAEYLDIQINCASRWEKIQSYNTLFGQKKDYTAELFHQFLWRSRVWRGQRVIYRENDNEVLNEFQKNTLPNQSSVTIPLYPNANNTLGKKLTIKVNQGYTIQPANIESSNNSAHLPFTLRQPISDGLGFFLFAEKYADLVRLLLVDKDLKDNEIKAFRVFYNQVWSNVSLYLKELYVLSTVMYYDKFGSEKLLEYCLWLDHVLGAIRIEKQYIFKEAPLKFLKESDNNLLDVISQAFRTEEVILFLKKINNTRAVYSNEKIKSGKGVQGWYKQNVLGYYDKSDFNQKHNWINENFINTKLNSK
ncbi:DUF262 domain-containing protein [Flavobacterium xanthum]|uniref:Uncharacterized protein n=1 Tax=Flavobacterium xanthum TaxID=69322 RepID=A0A1M7JNP9_9FLAO|nr:DUF262 domain-containing protein [Flavobacterium xanthum]SHM54739.1 Protein of unknown function DUF262 [Flavobacterium xanthum]